MTNVLPDPETLYRALVNRDSRYEGIFFVGVKTTGIFCRPTCAARKPKRENVEFFASAREALLHGYRPCMRCSPLAYLGEIPEWLKPLLKEINMNPGLRLKDADLSRRGIAPSRIRRWFQRHHGMTFQSYLRALRLGQALGRIKYGDKVIDAAFDSGYESLSGFAESFKKTTGFSPNQSHRKRIVTVTRILTPLGPMLAGAVDEGICLFEFMDRRMLERQIAIVRKRLGVECVPGSNRHFKALQKQIQEYFAGTRRSFRLRLVTSGTPFQEKVWASLQTIPYGTTRSYSEQAEILGAPESVRAVAKANGENRIAIIIPCHRVIGKDGRLTGYGGGLWRKQHLLNHELTNRRKNSGAWNGVVGLSVTRHH